MLLLSMNRGVRLCVEACKTFTHTSRDDRLAIRRKDDGVYNASFFHGTPDMS